ncbi:MAG: glycoside hydrolase family 38 N-terminal domain-containing protein [Armatimonadota bacterium]
MPEKQVLVVCGFHCDIVWRRSPAEQAAIREQQLNSAFAAFARYPEFRFEFDQAAVVREHLAAHPERLELLRELLREGRLEITGGEETIPDTNMVTGEGLARNIFLGRLWFAETLGAHPIVANLDDAFGLNAQLPQVLAGFGYRYFRNARTPGLDPELAKRGVLWEGLDGSRIFYANSPVNITEHTHVCNLPVVYTAPERRDASLRQAFAENLPVVYCAYASEEDLVNDDVVRMILDTPPPEGTRLAFALGSETLAAIQAANPHPEVVRGEFNPSQPGTHISRISLKLAYRQAEWATLVAEAAAACAALDGAAYPGEKIADMWRQLSVVQFHDALCGCHAQSVNRLVMGYCRQVTRAARGIAGKAMQSFTPRDGRRNGVTLFNPLPFPRREPLLLPLPPGTSLADEDGKPLPAERHGSATLVVADLPPLGYTSRPLVDAPMSAPVSTPAPEFNGKPFTAGAYQVTATHQGVTIEHPAWGRRLVEGSFPQVRFRLENGTLWDESFLGTTYTEDAGEQLLMRKVDGPVSTRVIWQGAVYGDPAADPIPPGWASVRNGKEVVYADLKFLRWEKELVFYRDLERIDVTVRLDWQGKNTEILLGFPLLLDLATSRACCEIPFGMLERKPYFEVPVNSPELAGAPLHLAKFGGKGAWPALGWVAYGDRDWGLVLANRGTPSHRLMSGMIEVGVLRSPTSKGSAFSVPTPAYENGRHEFSFSLLPYRGDLPAGQASRLGACFNAAPLVTMGAAASTSRGYVTLDVSGVAFSAWKRAERGEGYVLRTYETAGAEAQGALRLNFPHGKVYETDLMEEPVREVDPANLRWRPFEIKTLRIETGRNSTENV